MKILSLKNVRKEYHTGSLTVLAVKDVSFDLNEGEFVVILGASGAGKTTLLNILSGFLGEDERIITIEDAAELKLHQNHVISLETRLINYEGEGEVTIRDLVRNSLRMRPDRIIVGEVRGKEAFDMMQDGTIIINCARDVLVDEKAIGEALKSGRVKKYVTDFPNPVTAGMEGAIVLPHLGASTAEAEDNCAIMAVKELRNYIENGNIVNSVNYPACDMGVCTSAGRVAVCHKNVPAIISKITSVMGDESINIEEMANKSRGDYAYSMLDISESASETVVDKLASIEGVIKVRVIK